MPDPIGECEDQLSQANTAACANLIVTLNGCYSQQCRDNAFETFNAALEANRAAYEACKNGMGGGNP